MSNLVPTAAKPDQLRNALNTVEQEISFCPPDRQKTFKTRALNIRVEIDKYENYYNQGQIYIQQLTGPTAEAETEEDQTKNHRTDSNVLLEKHIQSAHKRAFDLIHKHGQSGAKNCDDFHQKKAKNDQLAKGESPKPLPPKPSLIKKVFFSPAKISVGLASGVSLNMFFNPQDDKIIMAAAFLMAIGLGVFLLALAYSFSFRAKSEPEKAGKYHLATATITIFYLITEGWLNYDGVISLTQQAAMISASQTFGQASETAHAPMHLSLLVFTFCLIIFAVLMSVLEGRDDGARALEKRDNDTAAAKLKNDPKLNEEVKVLEEAKFLESMRPKVKKCESDIDKKISQTNRRLDDASSRIQAMIQTLGNDVHRTQKGQDSALPLKLTKSA